MRMKWMVLLVLTLVTLMTMVTTAAAEGCIVTPGPIVKSSQLTE